MNKVIKILIFTILVLAALNNFSDEGMWMPHQMKNLKLDAQGLKMNPENLYKKDGTGIMSAVVNLGGGTGEFVSKDGLILTNHHVAFGAIQRASDKEHDYITDGFLAGKKTEEIPAAGYIAQVLIGYEEITSTIQRAIRSNMSYIQKYKAIDRAKKRLISRRENQGKDLRCTIKSMYSGNKYYLFTFKELKDIRLVYAPPRDIGNFGGDIDNWMWPRHTGDFTFLRAYVSKENIGVDYTKDNVPYKPKSFLKIALEGVKAGDFTFVMGYPGRTYRNNTLSELNFDFNRMKNSIDIFKDIINFYEKAGQGNRRIQIKYASKIKGLNNGLKNYIGKLEGLQKVGLLDKKKQQKNEIMNWINTSAERKSKYGTVFAEIDAYMKTYATHYQKNDLINKILSSYYSSALLSQAYTIYRTSVERQKPDIQRESRYQNRNLPYIKLRLKLADRGYDFDTDRTFLKHRLKKLLDFPQETYPQALKALLTNGSNDQIDAFVDNLFDKTILKDTDKRLELLEKKPGELIRLNDPLIKLASELEKELKGMREQSKALAQEGQDKKGLYLQALLEKHQDNLAPDANSSIRFTYGPVLGYSPKDAVDFTPITSLQGVMEKETGKFPFRVPDKLKKLYQQKDFGRYAEPESKSVPTCFLNTTNVTGGNSGSPVLNARGEQVGIVFDMTYESVIGDYYILPELQRTISVDIRYVIYITDKYANAHHLLKEMGL